MTAHDDAVIERVAVALADIDDEFSWHWREDWEKDKYRRNARTVLDAVADR
jgi:hypothetical protein